MTEILASMLPGRAAPSPTATEPREPHPKLRAAAERFEAAFLTEMLRHAGLGQVREGFNGGPGEAAFANSLVEQYANRIAAQGGLGLSENIYRSLVERAES